MQPNCKVILPNPSKIAATTFHGLSRLFSANFTVSIALPANPYILIIRLFALI